MSAHLPAFPPRGRPDPRRKTAGGSGGGATVTVTSATTGDELQTERIPHLLPHERVFPIQIGSELFKLSGASLSSDAPSYFSQHFQCQIKEAEARAAAAASAGAAAGAASDGSSVDGSAVAATAPIRTLYIDRDPVTFRDISLHLQGYYVQPRDGTHFVRLFADAQFYSLPRLVSQLYDEAIFISIGQREFRIPRDVFQDPGNQPNYFSLGFGVFFSGPDDLFPGLDRTGLIRPPSIQPPAVHGRSAETFAELLHLLRGYPVAVRDEAHRQALLRDCRYFNFKGLEQRLLPHARAFNQARQRVELALRLEDLLKSGVGVAPEPTPADPLAAWVTYARPFVDDASAELVLEIGREDTRLHFDAAAAAGSTTGAGSTTDAGAGATARAEFFRDTKTRVARLFEVIATKLNLPPTTQPLGLLMGQGGARGTPPSPGNTPLSDDLVRVVLEPATAVTLDGRPLLLGREEAGLAGQAGQQPGQQPGDAGAASPARKRLRPDEPGDTSMGGTDGAADLAGFAGPPPPGPPAPGSPAPGTSWIVKTGQWRLRIQTAQSGKRAVECVLVGVKLDALSSERARNEARAFLG